MIYQGAMFDEDYFIAKISSLSGSAVTKSDNAEAGQVPVADGEGGYAWGAATTGIVAATDPNDDGNVAITYTAAE